MIEEVQGLWVLALSCAFFLCVHMMISGTILKEQIIASIGPTTYRILFSLFSIFGFLWMFFAFGKTRFDPQNIIYWVTPFWLKIVNFFLNFVAVNLYVLGAISPSPTNLKSVKKPPEKPVYGIIRVSRHPQLSAIALFALSHALINPKLASWIFFGSIAALSILGAHSIDLKRRAQLGASYDEVIRQTSFIPFAAIWRGKPFRPHEIGALRMSLSVSCFTVIVVTHEIIFGRLPL